MGKAVWGSFSEASTAQGSDERRGERGETARKGNPAKRWWIMSRYKVPVLMLDVRFRVRFRLELNCRRHSHASQGNLVEILHGRSLRTAHHHHLALDSP